MNGAEDILKERQRQISKEGWTPEHDDRHDAGELLDAAIAYAASCRPLEKEEPIVRIATGENFVHWHDPWPWNEEYDHRKRRSKKWNARRRLVIAGALLAAEIDRLDREGAET